ncbi:hypothetical protein OTK51_20370, partial [Vibrio scophthalmi]|nr:hypothetical protein [Vibrio scophthalmi]
SQQAENGDQAKSKQAEKQSKPKASHSQDNANNSNEKDPQLNSENDLLKQEQNESEGMAQAHSSTPNQSPREDAAFRKLEQVEAARDPSQLIRAQLQLQAQQKQPPKESNKQW